MNLVQILSGAILFILLAGFLGVVLVSITGHDSRAYPVLPPEAEILIAGKARKAGDLAREYQPQMHLKSGNPSPPLLWVWYEAVQSGPRIDLTYYHVWEDEIHPDPVIHRLYRFFRAAYYGTPVRDVEFFQVGISTQNGQVEEILFETSPAEDYFVTISEHILARFHLQNGGCQATFTNRAGAATVQERVVQPIFNEHQPAALNQTWNHLTRLVTAEDQNLSALPAELKPLTNEEYAAYKFVRKGQGDHRTRESPWTRGFIYLAYITLLPAVLYLMIRPPKIKSE